MPYADPKRNTAIKARRYEETKALWAARQRAARQRTKDHIWAIKVRSKCAKCPNHDPRVLEFHHRDPNAKEVSASKMIQNKHRPARIDAELAKCDIVCANCHRIIHWEWMEAGVINLGHATLPPRA